MQMPTEPARARRLRPPNNGPRIRREKRTMEAMLGIYCRHHHAPLSGPGDSTGKRLCAQCTHLLQYALQRLDNCVIGELKSCCDECDNDCYSKSMRTQINAVLDFARPRLTLRHPLLDLLQRLDRFRGRR
ncbi:nitrous oxide-stimulated promoter family protein [Thiohalocapsa marina]|nr:nitrous oxide-stimulated promoter family protein [Thiohalocapsa marina]